MEEQTQPDDLSEIMESRKLGAVPARKTGNLYQVWRQVTTPSAGPRVVVFRNVGGKWSRVSDKDLAQAAAYGGAPRGINQDFGPWLDQAWHTATQTLGKLRLYIDALDELLNKPSAG